MTGLADSGAATIAGSDAAETNAIKGVDTVADPGTVRGEGRSGGEPVRRARPERWRMKHRIIRCKSGPPRLFVFLCFALLAVSDSRWDNQLGEDLPFFDVLSILGIIFALTSIQLRAWSVLYLTGRKTRKLVTEGPFSVCRNPIYLSTLLGTFGVALFTETATVPLLAALVLLPYYLLVPIASEETRLEELHGNRYRRYRDETPCLFPKFARPMEAPSLVVVPYEFRRWSGDGLWAAYGLGAVMAIDALHQMHALPVIWHLY